MFFYQALIGISSFFLLSSAIKLTIPRDGRTVELIPSNGLGGAEYRWDLTACVGCKMVVDCIHALNSCDIARIIIDDGQGITQYCPEVYPYIFKTSWKNKMTVIIQIIEKIDDVLDASCSVKSTPPYLNVPEKEIDSSEHGLIGKDTIRKPSCKCGWANKNPGRIINGKETAINEYPFPALIMFADDNFPYCGGSIITPHHILTAAHCTNPYHDERLSVAVGEHDIRTIKETSATKIHDVVKIYEHNKYNPDITTDDIAILEVAPKIEFNDKVGPVCLPSVQKDLLDDFVKVMGWGLTADVSKNGNPSPVIRKVNLRVVKPDVCRSIYEKIDSFKQICTYNNEKDTCEGDSGGPLVHLNPETNMYEQVALVSYGRECGSTDPAVNTNVAAYISWIKKQLNSSDKKVDLCF